MSETKRLKASQSPQLKIIRVVIIAPAVAIGKEGLTRIVGADESQFQVVAVIELIAQPVAQGGSQIRVIFLLEGDADGSHQFVMPVPQDLPQTGKRLLGRLAHVADTPQQFPTRLIERTDHHQLALRLHRTVVVEIVHDLLDLLGREEGQLLQLGTRGGVEVEGVLGEFAELVIDILPRG